LGRDVTSNLASFRWKMQCLLWCLSNSTEATNKIEKFTCPVLWHFVSWAKPLHQSCYLFAILQES